jgi:hypothetical protein
MFLFEFDQLSPLKIKLVAIIKQIQADIDSDTLSSNWTVDELLQYFRGYELIIDKSDLYDLIKTPPLNKFISNIKGDQVIFKGQTDPEVPDESESNKVIKQMAKKAMK